MADLIYRDVIKEKILGILVTAVGRYAGKSIIYAYMRKYRDEVFKTIDSAPAVDAVPVRHGRLKKGAMQFTVLALLAKKKSI